jgi:L-ribulose-5-phosphate 4-epimerase
MHDELKDAVCEANRALGRSGLVMLAFGNVSGIDREAGVVAIKPSGIRCGELTPDRVPVVGLDGRVVEGELRPSSDTPTHLALYRAFPDIGGITHTHSPFATAFAQARRGVPCLGTTQADVFRGEVPVTRPLSAEEVGTEYEANVGRVIAERFEGLDPAEVPGVLVAHHGPFTWGADPAGSVETAVTLEAVARAALYTFELRPDAPPIPTFLRDRHFRRKHGTGATYGQPTSGL